MEFHEILGEGAYGKVYKGMIVRQHLEGRRDGPFAFKISKLAEDSERDSYMANGETLKRANRQAQFLRTSKHPNIVQMYSSLVVH